jgi:hypothetical protein
MLATQDTIRTALGRLVALVVATCAVFAGLALSPLSESAWAAPNGTITQHTPNPTPVDQDTFVQAHFPGVTGGTAALRVGLQPSTTSPRFFCEGTPIRADGYVSCSARLSDMGGANRTYYLQFVGSGISTAEVSHSVSAVVGTDHTTSVAITSSAPNPSKLNEAVAIQARVSPTTASDGHPDGKVIFTTDRGRTLGEAAVNNYVASLNATFSSTDLGTGDVVTLFAQYVPASSYWSGSRSAPFTHRMGQATATTLTSAPNPSAPGATWTMRATVKPVSGTGTPQGTVTFISNGTAFATATLDAAGVATQPASATAVGDYSLSARYNGTNGGFLTSTSNTVVQQVRTPTTKATTATDLTVTPTTVQIGKNFTVRAAVRPTTGTTKPTGSVTFTSNGVAFATTPVDASGVATFTRPSDTLGSFQIVARYLGDGAHQPSTSNAVTLVVTSKLATATSIASSPNPSVLGQPVAVSVTVRPTSGTTTPTGTVTLWEGSTNLGTFTLASGRASATVTFWTVASRNLAATYSGDSSHASGYSPWIAHRVDKAGTGLVMRTDPGASYLAQQVKLQAWVSAAKPGAGTPTGNVAFYDGQTHLGTAAAVNGYAELRYTFNAPGEHRLSAIYLGSANYNASGYAEWRHPVGGTRATTVSLTTSPNPSVKGQTFTMRAVVRPTSGTGIPKGTVTFFSGGVAFATATLDANGVATQPTTSNYVGTYTFYARYNGDAAFAVSVSAGVNHQVR